MSYAVHWPIQLDRTAGLGKLLSDLGLVVYTADCEFYTYGLKTGVPLPLEYPHLGGRLHLKLEAGLTQEASCSLSYPPNGGMMISPVVVELDHITSTRKTERRVW